MPVRPFAPQSPVVWCPLSLLGSQPPGGLCVLWDSGSAWLPWVSLWVSLCWATIGSSPRACSWSCVCGALQAHLGPPFPSRQLPVAGSVMRASTETLVPRPVHAQVRHHVVCVCDHDEMAMHTRTRERMWYSPLPLYVEQATATLGTSAPSAPPAPPSPCVRRGSSALGVPVPAPSARQVCVPTPLTFLAIAHGLIPTPAVANEAHRLAVACVRFPPPVSVCAVF